jgi:hypothetical protein
MSRTGSKAAETLAGVLFDDSLSRLARYRAIRRGHRSWDSASGHSRGNSQRSDSKGIRKYTGPRRPSDFKTAKSSRLAKRRWAQAMPIHCNSAHCRSRQARDHAGAECSASWQPYRLSKRGLERAAPTQRVAVTRNCGRQPKYVPSPIARSTARIRSATSASGSVANVRM